jgi:light-regulated signal transduction histidine kinase (bacteriophytochrome)
VRHASQNAGAFLDRPPASIVGAGLEELFGPEHGAALRRALTGLPPEGSPRHLGSFMAPGDGGAILGAVGHRHAGLTILEFEPQHLGASGLENLYPLTSAFVARLQDTSDVDELNGIAAAEFKHLTGFDRVLVYRFEDDGTGTVVAEERNDILPSYLGHRFPASDVPKQARELYRLNRLRLIADADYRPVPILPAEDPETGRPLDLTYSALRSVSPVHLEYMRNMGTAASMSISILRRGELWGLISCHHGTPRVVPFLVRAACDFMGQVLSLQLAAKEHNAEYERSLELRSLQGRLLTAMAGREDYRDGLASCPEDLLAFAAAGGAAVVSDDRCTLVGAAPSEPEVRRLVNWLAAEGGREVYHTDSLAAAFPEAEVYKDRASGLLAIAVSKLHPSYVLWFRPEVARTVVWAGDPRKPADDGARLHPRKSFAMWVETVRARSLPFRGVEVEAATELRNAIIGIVLRQAEELAELSGELTRSNKELEAFSYSVSHDLRAPFRHIVGYSELLRDRAGEKLDGQERRYLSAIAEAAQQAGKLVDNLLAYSRMGRARLDLRPVDMYELVEEARATASRDAEGRRVDWRIGRLPVVQCDLIMVRQLLENLFSNALKYTRPRELAIIDVDATTEGGEHVFSVRDNGIGFDMAYADKLFGVFQRMHRMEDFEGTGIGLANVRRIAARHGGRTWAEAAVDRGATFYFTLPEASVRPDPALGEAT